MGRWDTRAVLLRGLWRLAGGVDVELALEDVVDDRLTEVIHNVSVPMLQGQSGGVEGKKGSEPTWGVGWHLGVHTNGEVGLGAPISAPRSRSHPPAFGGADD